MTAFVPYRPNPDTQRNILARAFSTVGTRASGRPPVAFLGGLGADATTSALVQKVGSTGGAAVASYIGAGATTAGLVGAAVGAIVGIALAALNKTDAEIANFDQAVALWQQNRTAVLNLANKYLVLAGLFDLSLHTNLPIYRKYGRMGEQRFVRDMANLIYQAAQSGQITANDTPLTIKSRIVQPWIDSFGFGPMTDPHADLIDLTILGMIIDYVTGNQTHWLARSGDYPFADVPPFQLRPPPPPPPPVAYPSPSSQVAVGLAPPPTPTTVTRPPAPAVPTASGVTLTWARPQIGPPPVTPPPARWPGFTPVGTDAAGETVYTTAQGVLYVWNGTSMVLFTGQLAGASSFASQLQSAIQTALAQGASQQQAVQAALAQAQAAGMQATPALTNQVQQQTAVTAQAPVQTAGVSSGAGVGVWAAAAGVLALLFATARPAR